MPYTTTITTTTNGGTDRTYTTSMVVSGDGKISYNDSIPSGTTGVIVNLSLPTGVARFLGISANGLTYPLSVTVDGTGDGSNTFYVNNNNQVLLSSFNTPESLDSLGNPFTGISNALYINNTGNLAQSFYIDALYDASPNLNG
jgi:hypothetical protein